MGIVFHCLKRSVEHLILLEKDEDYVTLQRVLEECVEHVPLRVLDYLVMPNHWHCVVWPQTDPEVSEFFRWLTVTRCMRWHAHYHTSFRVA